MLIKKVLNHMIYVKIKGWKIIYRLTLPNGKLLGTPGVQ